MTLRALSKSIETKFAGTNAPSEIAINPRTCNEMLLTTGVEDLHDLFVAAAGHHAGILIVRFDNDPRRNLTERGIATAISMLETTKT